MESQEICKKRGMKHFKYKTGVTKKGRFNKDEGDSCHCLYLLVKNFKSPTNGKKNRRRTKQFFFFCWQICPLFIKVNFPLSRNSLFPQSSQVFNCGMICSIFNILLCFLLCQQIIPEVFFSLVSIIGFSQILWVVKNVLSLYQILNFLS